MPLPSLRSLLEVGAHIGHKKEHSHPAARRFVYTVKEGILVINVEKTIEQLSGAIAFLKGILKEGGKILFVGTKSQAREVVKEIAKSLEQPYVVSRWLGGTLTNFDTVKKSLFQLEELEKKMNDPSFEELTKRERTHLKEKQAKLTAVFEGILGLTRMPEAMFVVDAAYEDIAVSEANRLGIPVVALTDTNANPELIQYLIPANDESKRAVELIMGVIGEQLAGAGKARSTGGVAEEAVGKVSKSRPPVKAVAKPKKVRAKKAPSKAKKSKTKKSK